MEEAMRLFRFVLTVPAGIAGWYLGVMLALLVHDLGQRLCPAHLVVSGACTAPWSSFVGDVALALGASVCGALSVLLPALAAPSHRLEVSRLAYAVGLICSAYWLFHGLWVPVAWAAAAGALALWRVQVALEFRAS
jgi:hypothetical protein